MSSKGQEFLLVEDDRLARRPCAYLDPAAGYDAIWSGLGDGNAAWL